MEIGYLNKQLRKSTINVPINYNAKNYLACPCNRIINATQFIFNNEHSIVNLINIKKIHYLNLRIYKQVRARRDGPTVILNS